MTIKYHTTRPTILDGSVGDGRSATTEGLKEVVTGYSMLPEVVMSKGSEGKILAETTKVERQEGENKERGEQNMAALAENIFKEVRDDEAGARHMTELEEKDGKETALPTTVEYKCAESSGTTYGRKLKGTPVTMTRPLLQLAESVKVEKKRLDELEHGLEKRVTARLEAQSTGPPYTAQILNAMIAENERDIAAVRSALKKRKRLEEREAKLARIGAGLYVQSLLNRDIQFKIEEEKDQKATQKAELPGARPSSRIDAGAFVCDPNWGVRKVIDPIDKSDQEQAVTAELLDEPTQLDFIQAQPPHPEIINNTTRFIILVILSYTMLWFYTYWKLSQQIYLAPTLIFVGFRVSMDLLELYQRVHQFWKCEDPKSIALAMLSKSIVKYVSTIVLTTWYGPCCALCTVWLVPSAIELLDWCSNGYLSFEKWCPRRIRLMQGPFTETTSDHRRTVRLASFGINTNRISLGILWRNLLNIVYYALTYVALFSRRESGFAKGTALVISMYLRSGQFPQPRRLGEADTMLHLWQREFDSTRESGRIRCPSLTGCVAQQCAAFREGCTKYSHLLKNIGRLVIFAVITTVIAIIIRI